MGRGRGGSEVAEGKTKGFIEPKGSRGAVKPKVL